MSFGRSSFGQVSFGQDANSGAPSPDVTVSISGQSIAVSAGSLKAVHDLAISGQSASAAQGAVTASPSVAATGLSIAASQGGVAPSTSASITGQSATASQGTASPATTISLQGQSITGSQGSVDIAGDKTVAITGLSIGISQGAVSIASSPIFIDTHDGGEEPRRKRKEREAADLIAHRNTQTARREALEKLIDPQAEAISIFKDAPKVEKQELRQQDVNKVIRALKGEPVTGKPKFIERPRAPYSDPIEEDDEEIFMLM